ncbi:MULTISPECIES: hypothetical protein [Yersinia pseudotuberculosis complex]|uniref:Phage protein n=1 Tax=Yersinia pseudotuberculosis serotype O:1b (strain IP 31758) TaxID=349747 RepID=A0A0U1R0C7_YERP3|nr:MULTISPECIES: hypothetical protein [Yersinia pseudotuberculosis complex]ABS48561.1 conserved hypothetical protein [Yersinia pseudotuberculosis IP 31758]MCE4111717.1 hypothetical protein [Yersinia pseudotuberculosis]MCF1163873.1 hypothetical protein [Yersinia pseudotuberculosis]RYC26432.1 hypothetical protein EU971_10355 [Yersinia pseudotuberculosis]UFA62611.1 Uncharacterized protein YP598_2996 [Yersinia pseudotuberculosis]
MNILSLALNDKHRLYLDAAGNLAVVTNLAACLQNCKTAMLAQRNEMIYAMDEGIPYRETLWDQYRPAQFEAAARTAIKAITGVKQITSFSIARAGNDFYYSATIKTEWGTGAINNERAL